MIYGISQDPDTNNYVMVLKNSYCKNCGEHYVIYSWCKSCEINYCKQISNWTSGNETVDDLIQEMRFEINEPEDIVFEWISYDQFNDIKEIGREKILFAIWKDGPLNYDLDKGEYIRNPNSKIDL